MHSLTEPSVSRLSKTRLRSVRALLRRKARLEQGLFLAEGKQAVLEAVNYGFAKTLIVGESSSLVADLAGGDVEILVANHREISQLATTSTPQDIIAVCKSPAIDLEDLTTSPKLVAICAQVRDPGNAGTVIRCADAFGADAVILTTNSVELTNPKTVRASVGTIFHVPTVTNVSFSDAAKWAAASGLQLLASDAGGTSLGELGSQLENPTAWVFGNEAWGYDKAVINACHKVVSVPMWGKAESLNLSTAAAVCLYATASVQHARTLGRGH